jgi:uncharacterized membrane protein YgdD (TMEM256/DUF423 family)
LKRPLLDRLTVAIAGLFGALATAGAALAAHGRVEGSFLAIAAAVAFVHAPALLALGLAGSGLRLRALPVALMTLGTLLFSGDLASRALLGGRAFVNAAPTGGSLLILGWLSLVVLAFLPARRP